VLGTDRAPAVIDDPAVAIDVLFQYFHILVVNFLYAVGAEVTLFII